MKNSYDAHRNFEASLRHIYNNPEDKVMKSANARSLALNIFSSNVLRESLSLLLAEIRKQNIC